ncbi:MAG: transglutaminase domain-containing protein [Deltaproteobacteria bacterium]|nr:transglutaminase domain-containing protein [Deltaproteobacteria bacterium]
MSRLSPLPVLVVLVLYGMLGPSVALAASFAVLLLFPQLSRARLALPPSLEVAISILAFGTALSLLVTFLPRAPTALDELPTPWAGFAGALLVVVLGRAYLASPVGAEPATLGLAMLALMACGGVHSGWRYPTGVVAFVAAALAARRSASRTSAPVALIVRRHGVALAVVGFVGVATTLALVCSLPGAHAWAMQRIVEGRPPAVGVGGRLWLGSMRGLLDSPHAVMRVRGEPTLLRGLVFQRYDAGRWSRDESRFEALSTPTSLGPAPRVTIEWLDGEPRRYFAPLDAGELALSSGFGRVDPLGNLEVVDAHPAARLEYRVGSRRVAPISEPSPDDVRVPQKIARALLLHARRVTEGAGDDAAKLDAIVRHLKRDYRYSLEFERSPYGDPVLEFLTRSREGHCEYFAAAMALLARSLGIPARVVVGYRAVERNPLTGDLIVRERDAHAWVEAWLDGWKTFDPTPAGDGALLESRRTPLPLAVLDGLGALGFDFLVWLDGLTLAQALISPLLVVALSVVWRWVRGRRRGRGARQAPAPGPLPNFVALVEALERAGLPVEQDATLESLARRVNERLPPELGRDCAQTLLAYAALRYGDHGDPVAIAEELGVRRAELLSFARARRGPG